MDIDSFLTFIKEAKESLNKEKHAANEVSCSQVTIEILDNAISITNKLERKAKAGNIKVNYLNQFESDLKVIISRLVLGNYDQVDFTNQTQKYLISIKENIDKQLGQIGNILNQIKFNLDFFDKIGYFDNNIVAIGANGSGKTTLSEKFKIYLKNNGVVISAQRILLVPNFDAIANPLKTSTDLKNAQVRNKSNKNINEYGHLQQEFGVILKNLLAENISASNNYRKESSQLASKKIQIKPPNPTKLDITFEIWNSLIEHKEIDCNDGINIITKSEDGTTYPAIKMSDGEKVMLYLIGQVLQAPNDGFVVIDEPEMYLHKTILKKLWDILEVKRNDCLFIYLTHDLDFATSRTTAKKVWIKSFKHPDKWEIENIESDEIPEPLLFELLGSRKNILFCEGVKGRIDEKVYSTLFSDLTIMPVGSCFDVINHTKAFNKIRNVNIKAFGLIDSDYHEDSRLLKLKNSNIYSFSVAEVENLFLDSTFLELLAEQLLVDTGCVDLIKMDVIGELDKLKEIQASNYVSTKVNYYFTDSDVVKGNALSQLENNYKKFLDKISIQSWFNNRIDEIQQIVSKDDYDKALIIFNNKGIKKIASKHLRISDFTDRSIKLLQGNEDAKAALNKYFPEELKTAGNNKRVNK